MCYLLYLSTDSQEDLAKYNNDLVKFEKITGEDEEVPLELLGYPNAWYVGSSSICSCAFRHIAEPDFGFSEPVDWYEEDAEDLQATRRLYLVFQELLRAGKKVDCVDKYAGTPIENFKTMDVSFSQVSEAEFRLFENYKFNLTL